MQRVRGALPLTVSLLLALGAVTLFGFSANLNPIDAILGRPPMVTIPDVIGDAQPRAVADLERVGLVPEVSTAYSLTAPRGSVISTDPDAGKRIRRGETVAVVVSKGANRVVMPDAVGQMIEQVRVAFDDADVPITIDPVHDDRIPEGTVLDQSPGAGTVVTGSDEVRFSVSAGPRERTVPPVGGLSPDSAGFALGQAGLNVASVIQRDDPSAAIGVTIGTEPGAGTVLAYGTPVNVVVSAGAAPVPVPDVVNTQRTAATEQLRAAGFVVAVGSRLLGAGEQGAGTVFEQQPAAGTPWRPGQPVTIVVGRTLPTPPPPPTTVAPTTTVVPGTETTTTVAGGAGD